MEEIRDLELGKRLVEIREKEISVVVQFDLAQIKNHYDDNVEAIKKQMSVAKKLKEDGNMLECEDILRSQIVFLESAFDFYVHELTKYGMMKIFKKDWKATQKYKNIQIDMETVEKAIKTEDAQWFLEKINLMYADVTLCSYSAVNSQMKLLGLNMKSIADRAFHDIHSSEKTDKKMKRIIEMAYKRRNVIAHQSDRAHANADKNQIDEEFVLGLVEDMNKIVNAINSLALEL